MKAQITIFIILMIIVMFIFGFVFYIAVQNVETRTTHGRQVSVDEIIANQNVDQKMKSCLDESVKQGLILLGKQGGYIYENQNYSIFGKNITVGRDDDLEENNSIIYNGSRYTLYTAAPEMVNYTGTHDGTNVSDVHYKNYDRNFVFLPYYYPCLSVSRTSSDDLNVEVTLDNNSDHDCLYRYKLDTQIPFSELVNAVPRLCSRNQTDCGCDFECNKTIQSMLENFVTKTFKQCFDTLDFKGFDVKMSFYEISSLFTSNTIDFELKPRLTIRANDTSFTVERSQIRSSRYKIKFKSLINILDSVLANDRKIANYTIKEGIYSTSLGLDPEAALNNPEVEFVRMVNYTNKFYHLVTVILDQNDGTVAGMPYRFSFAIENRFPILEHIPSMNVASRDIPIEVCGADPDDGSVSYSSTGATLVNATDCGNCRCFTYNFNPGTYNIYYEVKDDVARAYTGKNFDYETVQVIVI